MSWQHYRRFINKEACYNQSCYRVRVTVANILTKLVTVAAYVTDAYLKINERFK